MPLLFAVTLFVSASLLFMVQPMVGKLVLPLLGGSPAVWNACMVFFQALLLLGYLYADRLTRQRDVRKQWLIHLGVMALPVGAFVLAVLFNSRHTPIGVAESLAPTGGSNAILSVLAILTMAIGVPFFVVSTSATLLQKWFTYTGHPSARDPYFLYAASNVGSLLSLLGYPLLIEPNMTQGLQTWFWAAGFVMLFGLIAYCGWSAVNPLGVPPGAALATATVGAGAPAKGGRHGGQSRPVAPVDNKAVPATAPVEPPPSWLRMAKWTLLAFVPSSLMLGVTFHMTTDIASIPLLWVGPLALYLITFIIAFGRTPPWFRILIGNLAPVMILLLVFLMISGVKPGTGLELLLYNLTFFAAALMCHYELARDRPSPQYLTTYFLIMSFGGVLGGIFNSLLAPVIFPHTYEFPLALIFACLMVPPLASGEEDADGKPEPPSKKPLIPALGGLATEDDLWPVVIGSAVVALVGLLMTLPVYSVWTGVVTGLLAVLAYNAVYLLLWRPLHDAYRTLPSDLRRRIALALDIVIPVLIGVAFWQLQKLPNGSEWYGKWLAGLSQAFPNLQFLTPKTIIIVVTYALPVMVCFFFVDRPLRFALAVAAILGQKYYQEQGADSLYTERSFFGILKIEETVNRQFLVDRTQFHTVSEAALAEMRQAKVPVPESALQKLAAYKDKEMPRHDFQRELAKVLTPEEVTAHENTILKLTLTKANPGDTAVRRENGQAILMGKYEYCRLVHGTTLHGTQVSIHERHILDDFQFLTAANPWDNLAVMGAIQNFDMRQEPLTYYHRTGPVGAMFQELKRRGKEREHVAMVGLGTGSVACYIQKGQRFTFYEIDPAVRRLVEKPWMVMNKKEVDEKGAAPVMGPFTYVDDAKQRGGDIDFRMGDARLKLKETNDKYALLLVDAFSSDSIPVHLLTVEAVRLYLDRMTDDGILALHISNKFVKLEPVVAAIAAVATEKGLVARVWNDDSEGRHGKTASSWVALARSREHLGDRLCNPIADQMPQERTASGTYFIDTQRTLMNLIESQYPDIKSSISKSGVKKQESVLAWLEQRTGDEQAQQYARWIRKHDTEYVPLMTVLQGETGYGFRPLALLPGVDPWTDDYADVMRVMMIKELQLVRSFFGLPTPVRGGD